MAAMVGERGDPWGHGCRYTCYSCVTPLGAPPRAPPHLAQQEDAAAAERDERVARPHAVQPAPQQPLLHQRARQPLVAHHLCRERAQHSHGWACVGMSLCYLYYLHISVASLPPASLPPASLPPAPSLWACHAPPSHPLSSCLPRAKEGLPSRAAGPSAHLQLLAHLRSQPLHDRQRARVPAQVNLRRAGM